MRRPGGNQSGLHRDLIARIVQANPSAKTHGFYDDLTRHVVAESGDYTLGEYEDALPDVYSMTPSAFERRYLDFAKRYTRDRVGAGVLPDAFQFPEDAMVVVVWEVSVTNHAYKSINKWWPLGLELDGYDPWAIGVVSVDMHGICTAGFDPERLYRWNVDQPCPVPWAQETVFTERAQGGGVDRALARKLAGIRLSHDRRAVSEAAE